MGGSLMLYMLMTIAVTIQINRVQGVKNFTRLDFPLPPNFVFGAGTSAYQVEGAAFEDGRTPSIWDTYAHSGYAHGANGDVASDGYHKYKEDVHLMVKTGLEAYRFSISWSRLIPNGNGAVNPLGLQYYNNLIDELINHGIQPHVTLFHLDTPQTLEDEYGGWLSKKAVKDFVAYADICFKEFGDRVLHWTTFNEPNSFAILGYDNGVMPPTRCSSPFGLSNCTRGNSSTEPYIAVHNILLAHAATARLYSKKYKAAQQGLVGINVFAFWFTPSTNADVIATQRAHEFYIGWFLNPLVYGDYPEIMKKSAGSRIPTFSKLESEQVKGSIDFLGLNHYGTVPIQDMSINLQTECCRDFTADMAAKLMINQSEPLSGQLPVNPTGLKELLEYLKRYGNLPTYIHENGLATARNGTLNDIPRVKYIQGFIGSLLDAIRNGSNTRGYFIWSFLDVFELLSGYQTGYGLYYVDLDDKKLKRYPKLSAQWYSDFLKGKSTNSAPVIEILPRTFSFSQSQFSQ